MVFEEFEHLQQLSQLKALGSSNLRLLGQRNLRFREVPTGSAGLQNVVRQASDGTMGCRGCFQEVLKGEIPSIDTR